MIYGIWNFGSAPFNGSAFGGVPFGAMPARDLICLSAASKYTGIFDQPVTYPAGTPVAHAPMQPVYVQPLQPMPPIGYGVSPMIQLWQMALTDQNNKQNK